MHLTRNIIAKDYQLILIINRAGIKNNKVVTINRNSWNEKEEKVLQQILEKNKEYVLEYSFELACKKLNRSLSAIKQHYYYHKNKYDKQILKKEFNDMIKNKTYKIVKHKNLFIVKYENIR